MAPIRKGTLIAGLLLALVGLGNPVAGVAKKESGKKDGGTERVLRLKEKGFSYVHIPTGDILNEVLRGHMTLKKVGTAGRRGRQRFRTTEYVDGSSTPTGPTTIDVDLTVKIVAKKGKKGKVGSLAGTCTGSAVRDVTTGELDGVWTCTVTGGTGRFNGATGEATVNVHIVPVTIDPITGVGQFDISSVRAKGRISY